MCTVSYLPNQNGFILTSSRDEKLARPAARLAEPVMIGDQEVTFPKDPLGLGSWIATSNTRTICLLNGAFTAHEPKPPYKHSRGLVVLHAFEYPSIGNFAIKYDFSGLEPFTLLLIEHDILLVLRWNGEKLFMTDENASKPHIWSSATLYGPEVVEKREQWFKKWLHSHDQFSRESIRKFHKTAGDGDTENAVLMRRENQYATVSLTSVIKIGDHMEMIYEDLIHAETHKNTLSQAYAAN